MKKCNPSISILHHKCLLELQDIYKLQTRLNEPMRKRIETALDINATRKRLGLKLQKFPKEAKILKQHYTILL